MQVDLVVLALVLVLGCAAFFFGILYAIGQVIGAIGRGIASLFRPRRGAMPPAGYIIRSTARICPRPQCRKVEYREALFCSQCGAPMIEGTAIEDCRFV